MTATDAVPQATGHSEMVDEVPERWLRTPLPTVPQKFASTACSVKGLPVDVTPTTSTIVVLVLHKSGSWQYYGLETPGWQVISLGVHVRQSGGW